MTRRSLAALAVGVLLLAGCTRTSGANSGGTPDQVYAAGPSAQDVRSTLGSDTWWPSTPSFQIRPLGLPSMPDQVRFDITQRFIHVGSSEQLIADYQVWNTTSNANLFFTFNQNNSTTVTGPKVGDASFYTNTRTPTDTSLYDTTAMVRVGAVIMSIAVSAAQGYLSTTDMGNLAKRLVSKLKSSLAGKVKPSPLPSSDGQLLLPLGTDVTLAAAVRLPIEAAAELLGASSPQDVTDSFSSRGVSDFLYGDYALNADLNMEVRAVVFTFSNGADAAGWIDLAIGKSNLDANGIASGYAASIGEYYAFILAGSHVGMLFCNSLSPYEAASRACESPMGRLIDSWQTRLAA